MEKRIGLKLNTKNEMHRRAIEKLESYCRENYASMTDYILHAVLAYEEPLGVTEATLRKILREELGRNPQEQPRTAPQDIRAGEEQKKEAERKPEKPQTEKVQTEEKEKQNTQIDPATLAFMKELGI